MKKIIGLSVISITLIFSFLSIGYFKFTEEEILCRYPELEGCYNVGENNVINGNAIYTSYPFNVNGGGSKAIQDEYFRIGFGTSDFGTVSFYFTDNQLIDTHTYYVRFDAYLDTYSTVMKAYMGSTYDSIEYTKINDEWNNISFIKTATNNTWLHLSIASNTIREWRVNLDNIMIYDLTLIYGDENLPTTIEFETMILGLGTPYYEGEPVINEIYFDSFKCQYACNYELETADCLDEYEFGVYMKDEWIKLIDTYSESVDKFTTIIVNIVDGTTAFFEDVGDFFEDVKDFFEDIKNGIDKVIDTLKFW